MTNDRYFIRFKGRVLGPLTKDKSMEMVKRGQITRQHELSPDGITWKPATDFEELFVGQRVGNATVAAAEKAVAPAEKKDESAKSGPATQEWYAHFDGANQGPTDETTLKKWIAMGKVKSTTMVWKAGMASWLEAAFVRPEWFTSESSKPMQRDVASAASAAVEGGAMGIAELSKTAIRSQPWILFVAVLGIIVSVLALFVGCIFFISVASAGGGGPVKAMGIMMALAQIVGWAIALYIGILLLKVSSSLQALKYQANETAMHQLFHAWNRFWMVLGITTLIILVVGLVLGGMFVMLGASVTAM
jgi:hypothetical protein